MPTFPTQRRRPRTALGPRIIPSAPTLAPATGALEATASDANLAAQFAYADIPDAAAPPTASAGAAPFAPALAPATETPPQTPPRSSEAAVLYNKGDAARPRGARQGG